MRVLVIYASSRGGTADLARMVAEELVARGIDADVGDAGEVDSVSGYDAVIIGGALYHGRWHTDASWFVERNLTDLRETLVWFFSSGPLDDSARSGSLAPVAQVGALARLADICGHMTFGGVLAAGSTGFFASLLRWGKPGDYRDPAHVREWVGRIVERIGQPRPAVGVLDTAPEPARATARMLRRLAAAGDGDTEASEDLGLDVLMD